jgi:hypothetical protein
MGAVTRSEVVSHQLTAVLLHGSPEPPGELQQNEILSHNLDLWTRKLLGEGAHPLVLSI